MATVPHPTSTALKAGSKVLPLGHLRVTNPCSATRSEKDDERVPEFSASATQKVAVTATQVSRAHMVAVVHGGQWASEEATHYPLSVCIPTHL